MFKNYPFVSDTTASARLSPFTEQPIDSWTHTWPEKNSIRSTEAPDALSSDDIARDNTSPNEKCRVSRTDCRKRKHSRLSTRTHRLSLSLTAKQKAALVAAIGTRNGESPSSKTEVSLKSALERARQQVHPHKQQKTVPKESPLKVNKSIDLPVEKGLMASRPSYEDSKRERRRELGRKSQTAYRERRRQIEPRLMREIYALKDEVKKLEDWKVMRDGVQGKQQTDPIQTIRDVYYAIDCRLNQQQIVDVQKYEQTHGCSPALQYLLDLQREEFDSTASLELHWSWYRTQFRVFELSVTSFERVEAAEHVIIKIKGSLCLDICCSVNKGKRAIVCPVQHLFEFEKGNQAVTRITSEVDLIGGVMARQGQGLERALFALQRLSDSFGL